LCRAVLDPLAAFCLFSSTCYFLLTLLLGFFQERLEGVPLKCTRVQSGDIAAFSFPSSALRVSCLATELRGSMAQAGPAAGFWQAPFLLRAAAEVTGWPLPQSGPGVCSGGSVCPCFCREKIACAVITKNNKKIVREEITF